MEQFMRYIDILRHPSGVVTCIILVLNHTLRRQRRSCSLPSQAAYFFNSLLCAWALEEAALHFRRHRKEIPDPGKNVSGNMTESLQRTFGHHPRERFWDFIRQALESVEDKTSRDLAIAVETVCLLRFLVGRHNKCILLETLEAAKQRDAKIMTKKIRPK